MFVPVVMKWWTASLTLYRTHAAGPEGGQMSQPIMDWDAAYRQDTPPPWSIGRPQPELAALIEDGKVRSDVLDAGCGHAALSLALAARGYTAVGLDASATAIEAAAAAAAEQGLTTATFAQADVTDFGGYPPGSEGRFSTILDSGCFHALPPEKRQDYVRSIFRAAAPGASLFILAFAAGALGPQSADRPGPRGFTETELRDEVSTLWRVDDLRPAKLYGNAAALAASGARLPDVEFDNDGHFLAPGFLLSAHKPE
jgi:SAM-dependent methyltransferase